MASSLGCVVVQLAVAGLLLLAACRWRPELSLAVSFHSKVVGEAKLSNGAPASPATIAREQPAATSRPPATTGKPVTTPGLQSSAPQSSGESSPDPYPPILYKSNLSWTAGPEERLPTNISKSVPLPKSKHWGGYKGGYRAFPVEAPGECLPTAELPRPGPVVKGTNGLELEVTWLNRPEEAAKGTKTDPHCRKSWQTDAIGRPITESTEALQEKAVKVKHPHDGLLDIGRAGPARACTRAVPKILHFVWVCSNLETPRAENIVTWANMNPEYKIVLWVDRPLKAESAEVFKKASGRPGGAIITVSVWTHRYVWRNWDHIYMLLSNYNGGMACAGVADYVRLESVFTYGGHYFDLDFKTYHGLDNYGVLFRWPWVSHKVCAVNINNGLFGAEPGSPWLDFALDAVHYNCRVYKRCVPLIGTGPPFFAVAFLRYNGSDIGMIPTQYFGERSPVAQHFASFTWRFAEVTATSTIQTTTISTIRTTTTSIIQTTTTSTIQTTTKGHMSMRNKSSSDNKDTGRFLSMLPMEPWLQPRLSEDRTVPLPQSQHWGGYKGGYRLFPVEAAGDCLPTAAIPRPGPTVTGSSGIQLEVTWLNRPEEAAKGTKTSPKCTKPWQNDGLGRPVVEPTTALMERAVLVHPHDGMLDPQRPPPRRGCSRLVPKILHFVWVCSTIREKQAQNIVQWARVNPDYKVVIWLDEPPDAASAEVFKSVDGRPGGPIITASIFSHQDVWRNADHIYTLEKKVGRIGRDCSGISDYVRMECVFTYGGHYFDIDSKATHPLDDYGNLFRWPWVNHKVCRVNISNGLFGAEPGSPWLDFALDAVHYNCHNSLRCAPLEGTGPSLVTMSFLRYNGSDVAMIPAA